MVFSNSEMKNVTFGKGHTMPAKVLFLFQTSDLMLMNYFLGLNQSVTYPKTTA